MEIADDCAVTILYTLTDADSGEVLEKVDEEPGLTYLHGHANIIPGLEKELEGKEVGDEFDVTVAPEEGYGERVEELVSEVERDAFPEDQELEPGMVFEAVKGEEGGEPATQFLMIKKIVGDKVEVDANHPLAGKTLTFDGEIAEVREGSEVELQQGRPLRDS